MYLEDMIYLGKFVYVTAFYKKKQHVFSFEG